MKGFVTCHRLRVLYNPLRGGLVTKPEAVGHIASALSVRPEGKKQLHNCLIQWSCI